MVRVLSRALALAAAALGIAGGGAPAYADEQAPLTLCLAAAADDSPVYPLKEVPANHREIAVVFHLREGEAFKTITHVWTAIEVGDAAPANTEIARGDLALQDMRHGFLHFTLPKDLPVGKYRLDVSMDGKPWSSLDFPVVAAKEAKAVEKPADLLALEPGTTWTYSFEIRPGPIVKNMTIPGAEKGADGAFRATATYTAAAKEAEGTRVEIRRGNILINEEWWALSATGLFVARERQSEQEAVYDPPVPTVPLPLAGPASWTYKAKDGSFERAYRMWGPLPVATPKGEAPGWIVLSKQSTGRGILSIERHFVPGVGVVREVQVQTAVGRLLTRMETSLLSVSSK